MQNSALVGNSQISNTPAAQTMFLRNLNRVLILNYSTLGLNEPSIVRHIAQKEAKSADRLTLRFYKVNLEVFDEFKSRGIKARVIPSSRHENSADTGC